LNIDLSVSVGGLALANPVVLASGTFGYGTEYSQLLDPGMVGGIVSKAVTLKERDGNPPPRIAETPCGMLNSVGLENVGLEAFITEKLPAMRGLKTRVIINVAGTSIEEYSGVVSRLSAEEGLDAFELNVSCPNVKDGVIFGSDPGLIYRLVSRVRQDTALPLFVKLSPNTDKVLHVASSAVEAGADGLSLINTLYGMAIDVEQRKPVLGNITGGLSGPAIRPVGVYYTYLVCRNVRVPVIGMGGIATWKDALEYILAGASAVQVGTALFTDPGVPLSIIRGLREYCEKRGVGRISDLVGRLEL
jgi:dihydroorotate dehydrogenase (NAD+) catalytic subunit